MFAAWCCVYIVSFEIALKHADPNVCASAEKAALAAAGAGARLDCTAARYTELIPVML
eukprot:COSAG05_NODE_25257_length_198_cov_24.929293_1_plen_57_part_01